MHRKAYALFDVKSIDEEQRIIVGIAITPTEDRGGDEMDPKGAVFSLPMPFRWKHQADIGEVFAADVQAGGIQIKARIPKIDEPGRLKDELDYAWQSIKNKLARGLSIGWSPIEATRKSNGGLKVSKWNWVETSAVSIPMNHEATIQAIKSFDEEPLAATGTEGAPVSRQPSAGASASLRVVKATPTGRSMKKPIADQIKDFETTRAAKIAERDAIMEKSADTGETLDAEQSEQYETLRSEIKALDTHLARLRDLEEENRKAAKPVQGDTQTKAAASRDTNPVIRVGGLQTPPGVGLARALRCKMAAYLSHGSVNPIEMAQRWYPDDPRIVQYLKATVAGGTTTDTNWATELVEPTTLAGEFIAFLRPMTIIGKFGAGNIPSLRRLPFNIRIPRQTTGGTGYWVGEGAPKPLTSFQFDAVTLTYTKVAAIAVITQELARFSNPSADMLVRDQLAAAVVARLDTDFIDPAKAVSAGVNPASITNGLTALSSAGTSADNIRTDIQNLLEQFILDNVNPTGLVLIMPNTLALAASLMVNSLGQREFPDLTMNGGTLLGIPVITSQYAANEAQYGNLLIAVNASDLGLADDDQVTVDVSGEASLQMLDNPTNDAAAGTATTMVSMFQTNSLAIRAERFIHWVKLRSGAVVYMDDVNWGAIGSPV